MSKATSVSPAIKRELNVRRMTEIFEVSEDVKTGKQAPEALLARYSMVEGIASAFEAAHLRILQDSGVNFDEEDQVRAQFDMMHYAIKSTYHALEVNASKATPSNQSVAASHVKLPKIALPRFSGDLAMWPSFIALFNASIHENKQASPMEKYQYLLASLSGDALSVVKNLPLDAEHYQIAYDLLNGRYQNKRNLATNYMHSILNAKTLKADSAQSLRGLLDTFEENVRALNLMGFPTKHWDFFLLIIMLDKLTPTLREKFEAEHRKSEIPRYEQLIEFLREYVQVFSSMSVSVGTARAKDKENPKAKVASFVTATSKCLLCAESHMLAKCPEFLKLSAKERYSKVRELKLCINCLRERHRASRCSSSYRCQTCQAKHHTLLHFGNGSCDTSDSKTESRRDSTPETAEATTSRDSKSFVTSVAPKSRIVLLSTARAEIVDNHGNTRPVRILLDSASQSNFVTESCLQKGNFAREQHRSIVLAVNDSRAATTKGKTHFTIRIRRQNHVNIPVTATVLSRITSRLPNEPVEARTWKHLQGLPLADPEYHRPDSIDVLLGAEIYVSLLREGFRKGGEGEPGAFNTVFGWVLVGPAPPAAASSSVHSFVTVFESIDNTMKKFWQLEEVPDKDSSREDEKCEKLFKETTTRDASGRFIVSYPFNVEKPCFVDSRIVAVRRLHALERRFKREPEYKRGYQDFMRDYLEQGHMEIVRQPYPSDGAISYLPHHGVLKPGSSSTKLRVVFDASSKSANGQALNQMLSSGPKLQDDIMAILIRFRVGKVALTADVRQMFRQIWISPSQRDFQRIVWRFSEEEPVADYRLSTVTFGVAPSPYLAIRCLLELAEEGSRSHPLAAEALRQALYVDDIVASASTVDEARKLRDQLRSLLGGAGLELRKWASSHTSALEGLKTELCSDSMLTFDSTDEYHKILGLHWYSASDSFGFRVAPLDKQCTKRSILSELARIFDPLGFLAPLTFAAKRLIQRLWALGLDWDDEPPDDIRHQWGQYRAELGSLAALRIPRVLAPEPVMRRELHGFCDASEQGYGAVIYLRTQVKEEIYVRLVTAKSKVAPLKPITLPRLELCAALLLSRLIEYTRQILVPRVELHGIRAWSDSMVTLAWIKSEPQRWRTFVRNRVAQIQSVLKPTAWGHVGTDSNPADYCSRGLTPLQLVNCTGWWQGPSQLHEVECRSKPEVDCVEPPVDEERVSALVSLGPDCLLESLIRRVSSLDKICRIVAYCLRFRDKSQGKTVPDGVAVDQIETHSALLALIRILQGQCFDRETDKLCKGKRVAGALRKLAPFLDASGLLRVGGRIAHSALPYEAKHPALLPGKHRLTELIIEQTHRSHLHAGRRETQYLLAQHFWILGVHQAIRRVLSKCHNCFKANPRPIQPPMAALPIERVNQVKPFSVTGVDYAGPFMVTLKRARGAKAQKMYVCLFVCFVIKAVHLELAFSLSTDSFMSALRRFLARRGRCSLIFSDCGTNFVGAHKELASLMREAAEGEKLKWSFNPPSAPHFGGIWETGVKSMKTHLRRAVGEQILSVEEFSTVLTQIEAVMNSRPLCSLSSDPRDLEVLSPGHFLTFEPLVSLPDPDLASVPIGRLGRWQLVQQIQQNFWKRWHREYLHTLQQRPKWFTSAIDVREGSLVLIKDDNLPPLRWKRGRIVQLSPGSDGIARVARVRTAEGMLDRPLVKLCPLPMGQPSDRG